MLDSLLALAGSLVNALFGRALKEPAAGIIASVAVGAGFVLSMLSAALGFAFLAAGRVRDGLDADALAGAGWEGSCSEAAGDAGGAASWSAATGGAG